jgi:phage terminase large subunit GpA-like protein
VTQATPLNRATASFLKALRPPRKLSVSEWADRYAILSAESSAEAGRWHTIPYQKKIMDSFNDPTLEQIWVMKSARVGFTKIINHVCGYHIHQDPCSIMVVQPTVEDAEGYSKEEIAPMIRDTPVLSPLVSESKAKDGGNTILAKSYPGGTLSFVGANSPRGFRRVSKRIVLFDEIDGYPETGAGNEGDQIKLGIRRTEYFWNRKVGGGSTPLIKETSRIAKLFESGDQQRYFVPCPHCKELQYLKFKNLKWPEGKPEDAFFVCEKNGCVIEHSHKRWMVENGDFIPTAVPSDPKIRSYHIWAAYSYSPNASWGQIAKEFLEAKVDAKLLQTFINTVLGETWEEEYSSKLEANVLMERAEDYSFGFAPKGVLLVTAGVDVQDNRFEIQKVGWGVNEESWVISYDIIYGDPSRPEIWKQLDEALGKKIKHETGVMMDLAGAAIDSGGHYTHEVYQYCRERKHKNYIAIKGASQKKKPVISPASKVDINFKGQAMKHGGLVYTVGTDTVKDVIYGRLKHNEPGHGFIHFSKDLTNQYYDQLTAEKKVSRLVKGRVVREWILPSGKRNEALDTIVYSYCLLHFIMSKYHRPTFWTQMEAKLVQNKPAYGHDKGEQAKINPSGKNFVNSW